MQKRALVGAAVAAVPLLIGGLVYANTAQQDKGQQAQQASEEGYSCPVTGEELPCPACCPLSKSE